jgi:hypothetical protein
MTTTYREGATLSRDMAYRYRLWRRWDDDGETMMFLMLNPSTATAFTSDPTITRCINRAKRDGFGAVEVCNLYAYRSTDPEALYNLDNPIGDDNLGEIISAANMSAVVILGWGEHGDKVQPGWPRTVLRGIKHRPLLTLEITASGQPKHPLYIADKTVPKEFEFVDDDD